MDLELAGRAVLVTGGASHIGRGIVHAFAAERARIVIADIDAEQAERTAEEARRLGAEHATVAVADLSSADACREVVATAIERLGGIDVLVNNVGRTTPSFFLEQDAERWDQTYALNLRPVLACTHAALAHMRSVGRGCVVSIASIAAFGEPRQSDYGAAKAGVIALTKSLAREFGRYGIRVNAVAPGLVPPTDASALGAHSLWRDTRFADEQGEAIRRRTSLGRLSMPRDIANAVLFFASEVTAGQITGEVVSVSGGYA